MGGQQQFLASQQRALLRAAFLLTGQDALAQDLVQETVVRVLLAWRRVERADVPEAYVQRVLLMTFLADRRRSWVRELPHPEPPETPRTDPGFAAVDDLDALRRALQSLPPRQRAAVVLRHYEDRSELQTAQLLGCSVGTVKSLTSRGLAALRTSLVGRPLS